MVSLDTPLPAAPFAIRAVEEGDSADPQILRVGTGEIAGKVKYEELNRICENSETADSSVSGLEFLTEIESAGGEIGVT